MDTRLVTAFGMNCRCSVISIINLLVTIDLIRPDVMEAGLIRNCVEISACDQHETY